MRLTADLLRSMSTGALESLMSSLSDEEAAVLKYDWSFWAREDQLLPPSLSLDGDKVTWLALAGRGWGKTRVGSQTVIDEVYSGRSMRIALVAETAADARDVMIEGDSGIMACSPPWFRPVYEPSKRRITWPNGAVAHTYNAVEPDQLRGPQFDFAWGDELAKWRYAQDTFDNLQFGLRLGRRPRQLFTTTPRPIPIVRALMSDPTVEITRGRTLDNAANLASSFLLQVKRKYEGTRLGRQELNAEILDDVPGALWSRAMIERALMGGKEPPPMRRIVVAIDPSGSSGDDDTSDEIGIVAAGLGEDDLCYVLADETRSDSPAGWGQHAVNLYKRLNADCIIAEGNFGGAMVEHVIRSVDENVPYRQVTASRGKAVRAEPVSALYEQGRVRHVGSFPQLEDQMSLMARDGWMGKGSPDHLDALVWAVTELMLGDAMSSRAIFELMRRESSMPRAKPEAVAVDYAVGSREWEDAQKITG